MSKARILYQNLVLASSGVSLATSSTPPTGYEATNLQNQKRGLPWRSPISTSAETLTITFAGAKTIQAIFLINWKAHGSTIKIETKNGGGGYSNFGGGTGLPSLPTSNRTRLTGIWNTGGTDATDVKITFATTGGSDYAELGLVYIVDSTGYFAATVNVTDRYAYQPIDLSEIVASVGGQEEAWQKSKILTLENEFVWIAAAQQVSLLAIHDTIGINTFAIFAVDPDNLDEIVYGRFQKFNPRHLTRDQWAIDLAFREAA